MADPTGNFQESFDDLTEKELNKLIASAKVKRETLELRSRFPSHLAELASRIQVCRPNEKTVLSQRGGAKGSSFAISKNKTHLSVLINTPNEQPISEKLTLTRTRWNIYHNYLTGYAGSETISLSLSYGDAKAKAFITEYSDCGQPVVAYAHGGVGGILQSVLQDLGSALSELELLEMLLDDDPKAYLNAQLQDYPLLREIIERKLEGEEIGD